MIAQMSCSWAFSDFLSNLMAITREIRSVSWWTLAQRTFDTLQKHCEVLECCAILCWTRNNSSNVVFMSIFGFHGHFYGHNSRNPQCQLMKIGTRDLWFIAKTSRGSTLVCYFTLSKAEWGKCYVYHDFWVYRPFLWPELGKSAVSVDENWRGVSQGHCKSIARFQNLALLCVDLATMAQM